MVQITAGGIGSGLDINGLVSQLVAAERAPTENRLNQREARVQARLSAYGGLKAVLESFQESLAKLTDVNTYSKRTVVSSNTDVFTASAGASAVAGNYTVEVQQLATQHKIASAAYASSSTEVGTGTLDITVNGSSFSVDIDSDSDTLAGIRDAINSAEDNVGVTASIVQDQDGSHLVLTSDSTGVDNKISVAVTTDGGDTGDLTQLAFDPMAGSNPMSEQVVAKDAIVVVDGFTQNSASNSVTNIIDGVTLDLVSADLGNEHTLTVSQDKNSVRSAVEGFVTAYNSLRGTLNDLTAFDPETQTAGLLQGDSTTLRIASQLRQEISASVAAVDDDVDTLVELGITSNVSDGKLNIDDATLTAALNDHFSDFKTLFAGDDGFAVRLDAVVENYTRVGGLLDNRTDGLQTQIDRINSERDALDRRIAVIQQRFIQQFTALDTLLGELNTTSNFLSSQLASLPRPNSGNS